VHFASFQKGYSCLVLIIENRYEKYIVIISRFQQILQYFILEYCHLPLVRRGIGGIIGWLGRFLRLQLGNHLVFGIQPGTQIHQLAPAGAKRKVFCLFGLCLGRHLNGFVADWTSVFHTKILIYLFWRKMKCIFTGRF